MASQSDQLYGFAQTLLKGHVWEAALVLRIGASLAEAVNKYPGLTGEQKSELVVLTILRLLDDGEKAEKERSVESTGTETTKVPWAELRDVVKTLLPQTLALLVDAARGKLDLAKVVPLTVEVAPLVVSCCVGWFAKQEKNEKKQVPAPVVKSSEILSNPLPLASLPPKERAPLEVREPVQPM